MFGAISQGKASEDNIEALAIIAIIGAETNIRISNRDPLAYFAKYGIDASKRKEQFIEGEVTKMTPENFPSWLEERVCSIAFASNKLLDDLNSV